MYTLQQYSQEDEEEEEKKELTEELSKIRTRNMTEEENKLMLPPGNRLSRLEASENSSIF